MQKKLQKACEWLLELVFPEFCLGCKREGAFLCPHCLAGISLQDKQCCPYCYRPQLNASIHGRTCATCVQKGNPLDGLIAATRFDQNALLKKCIHALKYDFVMGLADPLGELLLKAAQNFPPAEVLLCPLPLHQKRLRWRGFNQAELLTNELQKKLSLPITTLLTRTHFSRPQMELKREERIQNVENVFAVVPELTFVPGHKLPPDWADKTIIIVDDIATTLSTMNSAAKALKNAGAKRVWGLVLARAYE